MTNQFETNQRNGAIAIVICMFLMLVLAFIFDSKEGSTESTRDRKVDNIILAKDHVLKVLNYPDTADFHEMKTTSEGNIVKLTVTAKNGFGVPKTRTFNVKIVNGKCQTF